MAEEIVLSKADASKPFEAVEQTCDVSPPEERAATRPSDQIFEQSEWT